MRQRECQKIAPFLWDYSLHRLPTAQQAVVEAHLSRCPECQRQAEEYGQTTQLLQAYRQQPVPGEANAWQELRSQLQAKAPQRTVASARRRLLVPQWGGVLAACGLLLFLLRVSFSSHLSQNKEPEREFPPIAVSSPSTLEVAKKTEGELPDRTQRLAQGKGSSPGETIRQQNGNGYFLSHAFYTVSPRHHRRHPLHRRKARSQPSIPVVRWEVETVARPVDTALTPIMLAQRVGTQDTYVLQQAMMVTPLPDAETVAANREFNQDDTTLMNTLQEDF